MGYKSQEGYKIKVIGSFSIGCNSAKFGIMDAQQTNKDLDIEYEERRLWMEMYGSFLKYGLSLFEPDGKAANIGVESLLALRTHFEEREAYGRAEYVHGLIEAYHKLWPTAAGC